MSDRGQLEPTPIWLPVTLTVLLVLAVVAAELRDAVAAVDGPVAFCGLCDVDWRPTAMLLIIGVLVAIGARTVSFFTAAADSSDDE